MRGRRECAQAEGSFCSGIFSFLSPSSLEYARRSKGKGIDSRVNGDCKSHIQFPGADYSPMGQHGLFLVHRGASYFLPFEGRTS